MITRRHRPAGARSARAGRSASASIGAGFMAPGPDQPDRQQHRRACAWSAISNRRPERAFDVCDYAGRRGRRASSSTQAELRRRHRAPAAASSPKTPFLLCRSEQIDVLVDVTGSVEFGAHVVLEAFKHGKDVVLMNAEIDATIGPILQVYAQQARRHPVGLRRRRAGRADEPRPLGQGPRADPARDRQRQGTAGSLSQPDHAEGLRRAVGPEPGDGDELRRRLEDQLRAGDRRQRDRLQSAVARHVARARVSTATS